MIDHITQTLPAPEGGYVKPLLPGYIKALLALFSLPAVTELLGTYEATAWFECIDFVLEIVEWHLGSNGGSATPLRDSPAPGTPLAVSLPASTFRSTATSSSQRDGPGVHHAVLTNLLECIQLLVSATNAPIIKRSEAVTSTVLQCVRIRSLGLSPVLQLGFSILNSIVQVTQIEDIAHTNTLVIELLPVIHQWWQAKTTSQENALLNSIQVEALRLLLNISPNIEHLVLRADANFIAELEELCDRLWSEYSNRDVRGQLQQDDITYSVIPQHPHAFTLQIFSLRPYIIEAERRWAVLQVLGLFESMLWKQSQSQHSGDGADDEEHPRKRRRLRADVSRLRQNLQSPRESIQLTALQLLPFFVSHVQLPLNDVGEILSILSALVSHKSPKLAVWATVASARYARLQLQPLYLLIH